MESAATPFRAAGSIDLGAIDLERLAAACEAAAAAVEQADGVQAAIDGAIDALHEGLSTVGVAVFVVEHGRLWSVGVRGYAMIPDGLPLSDGVIGRAVRTGTTQLVVDVACDPDFVEVLGGVVSELAIPLALPTGVVGVVNIETTARLPLGGEHLTARLAETLSPPLDELRAARGVDLSSLARLFVYMSSLRDPLTIAEVAVRALGRILPIETSQLLLLEDGDYLVESTEWRAADGGPEPVSGDALQALRERIDPSAVFELLDTGMMRIPELIGTHARSVVLMPLRANGQELGLLAGASRFAKEFDRGQGELAALLAAHTAASLDAALSLGRERRSAHTDVLTGLLNRRGLEVRLDRELDEAQVQHDPLSLIVLDCDDFKEVNDRAGHELGDALLREIGIVIEAACPVGASAARLGGDEFVVILPGIDADAVYEVAEQLRKRLDDGLDDAGFPLRMSAGLATYPYDGGAASQLLRAADQALYRAKAQGKNRVVGFRDVVRGTPALPAAGQERNRASGVDGSMLADAMDASAAIWDEATVDGVLERLSKSATFVVGGTGAMISKVEGSQLVDAVGHSMRDNDLGEDTAYLISDFPVTKDVLERGVARSISFLDEQLDRAEAFVLRELGMNCALLLPLIVRGCAWGLVEVYDMRMRHFSREDEAVASFLVGQAGRRIESLGEVAARKRRLPLFRVPSS